MVRTIKGQKKMKNKRALVLSGGGSKGAWQVGVLKCLAQNKNRTWDIVAGVSVGALNGSFISQYEPANQKQGTTDLEALWNSIKGNRSIYRPHTLGQLGQVFEGGLFSTKPLRDLISQNLDRDKMLTSGVKLSVGAISCTTGEYKTVTQDCLDLHDWIIASSAFPVAFPPVKIDGDTWTDGGIGENSPILDVLLFADEITEIDFVSTEPIEFIIPVPEHIKVTVYSPKEPLGIKPLSFDATKIQELILLGYQETLNKE
jgi:predicted acylesterase/phospholipase RssA